MTRMKNDTGYTLVELLVTMLITTMLVGVLLSVYLAVQRWVEPWRQGIMLENNVHVMMQRLTADVTYAAQLIAEADSLWTLTYPSGHRVQYRFRNGMLARNGRRMHDADASVVRVRITPSRPQLAYALQRREQRGEPVDRLVYVEMQMVLQSRTRTLSVTTTTGLRHHRPWQPLAKTPWPEESNPHEATPAGVVNRPLGRSIPPETITAPNRP